MQLAVSHDITVQPVQHYQPSPSDLEHTNFLIKDLSKGAQLLIWSIRKWVQLQQKGQPPMETLSDAYRLAGIPEGALILDEFMSLLAHVAIRPVLVECPCKKTLSCDELVILRTLRSLQNGNSAAADQVMARLVKGNLRAAFCRSAEAYAQTVKQVNLSFDQISVLRSAV